MRQTKLTIVALLVLLVSVSSYGSYKSEEISAAKKAYDLGKYDECAEHYKAAIKIDSDSGELYYKYAACLALQGNLDGAFENLEKALENGFIAIDDLKKNNDFAFLAGDKRWLVIVSKGEKYLKKYLDSVNIWVYQMFESDRLDRKNFGRKDDWSLVAKKDSMRRERIKGIMAKSELKVSDDYYHAAMIMHHGTDSTDYRIANELAAKAVELDSKNEKARWLFAASKDRHLLATGKPQIYGTQYNYVNGRYTLDPFDRKAISDKQRKKWGVPSLDETQKKIARLNGIKK